MGRQMKGKLRHTNCLIRALTVEFMVNYLRGTVCTNLKTERTSSLKFIFLNFKKNQKRRKKYY